MLHVRQNEEATTECRDDPNTKELWCSECGGKGDDGKCKGLTDDEDTDLWKGCPCHDAPDFTINPSGLHRPNYEEHKKALHDHLNLPDENPKPTGPTKVLQILTDFNKNPKNIEEWAWIDWLFFATDYGTAPECRTDTLYHEERKMDPNDEDHTYYPGGEFPLKMPGFDQDCTYKNNGENAGRLFCPGKEIECKDDPHDKDPSNPEADKGTYDCDDGKKSRQPVFLCEY
ncbi:hypothetical protein BCR34DRAFT_595350 [Clohesyomyces aquaticus]|uniref:Uncharacterized protein n=1 Tax=Clohesyomyces aquaticus TaxID=1231657 RepID=A0A1Y2AA30_9PLEO|nr:hypothetical protein BCR34DRAFT_595350 [Clohesyomyces aquaticus]